MPNSSKDFLHNNIIIKKSFTYCAEHIFEMRLKCLLLLVLYFAALITQARGAAMGQMNRRNYRRLVQIHIVF